LIVGFISDTQIFAGAHVGAQVGAQAGAVTQTLPRHPATSMPLGGMVVTSGGLGGD
jgi:hypothetical protein